MADKILRNLAALWVLIRNSQDWIVVRRISISNPLTFCCSNSWPDLVNQDNQEDAARIMTKQLGPVLPLISLFLGRCLKGNVWKLNFDWWSFFFQCIFMWNYTVKYANNLELILVQVMAWSCQATSHYLSQCWPRSLSPYGITRRNELTYRPEPNCYHFVDTFSNAFLEWKLIQFSLKCVPKSVLDSESALVLVVERLSDASIRFRFLDCQSDYRPYWHVTVR